MRVTHEAGSLERRGAPQSVSTGVVGSRLARKRVGQTATNDSSTVPCSTSGVISSLSVAVAEHEALLLRHKKEA